MSYGVILDDSSKAIKDAYKVFSGPAYGGPVVAGREDLKSLCLRVRGDSGKVGVLFSTSQKPDEGEVRGLVGHLVQGCASALACYHHFTFGASETLRKSLQKQAETITEACVQLCQSLKAADAAEVKKAVGLVWSACDSVSKTPLDNKAALFAATATVLVTAGDIRRELDELSADSAKEKEANAKKADEGAEADDKSDAGSDMEFQLDTEALSAAEEEVVDASKALLGVGLSSVKGVSRLLLQGPVVEGAAAEGWESAVWHCRHLQSGLEELGASLYAPQVKSEVEGAGESIYNSIVVLLQEVPPPPEPAAAASFTGALEKLEKELEVVMSRFRDAVSKLREDGEDDE